MALESGTYISDLNPSNPVGATDKVSTLDDHIRLVKSTLQNTFPNIDGAVNATEDQINLLAATSPNDRVLRISGGAVGWGQLTTGMFPSQVVPDAALSDNVPLKDAANVFTRSGVTRASAAINIEASQPSIGLYESDAPTDAKYVQVRLDNGRLSIRARTDADELGATLFSASRNGATWEDVSWEATGKIDLTAPTLGFNGSANISGTLGVGGVISAPNGSAAAPAYTFSTDSDLGIYRVGGNRLGISGNGITVASFATDEIDLTSTTLDFNGNVDVSGTLSVDGAVTAGTIATSTSTTLVTGQVHAVTNNATLPNMTAGQWVGVINNSNSPITVTKNANDTMYWTASGASVTSVTVAARGKATFFAANNTNVYASGNITGAS